MPHIENQPKRQANLPGDFIDLLNDPQFEKRANESAKLQHKQQLERKRYAEHKHDEVQ